MNDKKSKIITIAALIVAVIGLSIGFAAFASTLNITSGASVTPANDFYVKFADSVTGSGTFTNYTENNVFASNTSTGVGNPTGGVINNNDGVNPIISNLTAAFTAPGQSVTYDFYVVNDSAYTAYLNEIKYMSGKTCTSDATSSNPATQSLVDNACSGITSTVEVGGLTTVPQTLGSKEYKTVKVTISYNGEYVDGAFKVTFGDIKLIFSTVEGEEVEENLNFWQQNGLLSNNVEFNKTYASASYNRNGYVSAEMIFTDDICELYEGENEEASFNYGQNYFDEFKELVELGIVTEEYEKDLLNISYDYIGFVDSAHGEAWVMYFPEYGVMKVYCKELIVVNGLDWSSFINEEYLVGIFE